MHAAPCLHPAGVPVPTLKPSSSSTSTPSSSNPLTPPSSAIAPAARAADSSPTTPLRLLDGGPAAIGASLLPPPPALLLVVSQFRITPTELKTAARAGVAAVFETAEESSAATAVERRRAARLLLLQLCLVVDVGVVMAPAHKDGTKPAAAARDRSLADLDDTPPLSYDSVLIATVCFDGAIAVVAVVGDTAVTRAAADRTPASRSPLVMISQDPPVDEGITSLAPLLFVQLHPKQGLSHQD